ncbi:hypothetical protein VNO78_05055 [Psophocarpus tetragonolobus]|uniref:Gamma-glutamylcyclotransferase family protein n=1 Tax=Psophocarpus tetragonolobus TaxID=3891 RepID=A0AAN9SQG9_PSOTE
MVAEREVKVKVKVKGNGNGNGDGGGEGERWLIFTYGTLKRGFSNHPLLQDLIRSGDASFVGTYRTAGRYPLVCGPYRVPFLLNFPGSGRRVHGELYSVSTRGLARMDELEGTSRAHYQRLPIQVLPEDQDQDDADADHDVDADADVDADPDSDPDPDPEGLTCAQAYYAHTNYAMDLWNKNGKRGLTSYSLKHTVGYVKRKDRPQHLTFLDHIRFFISSN